MISKISYFNSSGVIDPIAPGELGMSRKRSPYILSMSDFISIFAVTPERTKILKGLLRYRSELYKLNIVNGFQWLNGSFTTDIETLENRPPSDIDVVTFFELPEGETQQSFLPKTGILFQPKLSKEQYKVDGYPTVLAEKMTPHSVRNITYWYSMWSHRKSDNMWKGYFEIPLSYSEDTQAIKLLMSLEGE